MLDRRRGKTREASGSRPRSHGECSLQGIQRPSIANSLNISIPSPPRPPAVPSHLLFDGLSSMRRTFDLPHRMALGDVVELFVEIWEVQQ
jgi:hypothetical protein